MDSAVDADQSAESDLPRTRDSGVISPNWFRARSALRATQDFLESIISGLEAPSVAIHPAAVASLRSCLQTTDSLFNLAESEVAAAQSAAPRRAQLTDAQIEQAIFGAPRHFAAEQHERTMRALQSFVAMQVERSTTRRGIKHLQRVIHLLKRALDDTINTGHVQSDAETDIAEALASLLAFAETSDIDVFAMLNLVEWKARKEPEHVV